MSLETDRVVHAKLMNICQIHWKKSEDGRFQMTDKECGSSKIRAV